MSRGENSRTARPAGRPRVSAKKGTDDVRRDILTVAAKLISERGWHTITMAEIAAGSGLQAPSLYYYYPGKAAILLQLAIDANRAPLGIIRSVNESGAGPAARLWLFVALDVRALCDLPFDINDVHRFVDADEESAAAYEESRAVLIDEVEKLVDEGVRIGDFRDVDARLAALSILGTDEGSQNWMKTNSHYSPGEVGTFLADSMARSLLSAPDDLEQVRATAIELSRSMSADGIVEPLHPE